MVVNEMTLTKKQKENVKIVNIAFGNFRTKYDFIYILLNIFNIVNAIINMNTCTGLLAIIQLIYGIIMLMYLSCSSNVTMIVFNDYINAINLSNIVIIIIGVINIILNKCILTPNQITLYIGYILISTIITVLSYVKYNYIIRLSKELENRQVTV